MLCYVVGLGAGVCESRPQEDIRQSQGGDPISVLLGMPRRQWGGTEEPNLQGKSPDGGGRHGLERTRVFRVIGQAMCWQGPQGESSQEM